MCVEISRLFLSPTTRLLTVEGENILEIQRGGSTLTTSTSQRNNTTLCFKQNHKQTQASRGRG